MRLMLRARWEWGQRWQGPRAGSSCSPEGKNLSHPLPHLGGNLSTPDPLPSSTPPVPLPCP